MLETSEARNNRGCCLLASSQINLYSANIYTVEDLRPPFWLSSQTILSSVGLRALVNQGTSAGHCGQTAQWRSLRPLKLLQDKTLKRLLANTRVFRAHPCLNPCKMQEGEEERLWYSHSQRRGEVGSRALK